MKNDLPPPPDENPTIVDHPLREETLRKGGGGPYNPGMEQRVEVLEKRMGRVEDKLDRIAETVARIEGKLDAKVDYKWALAITTAVILVILRSEIMSAFTGLPHP